MMNMNIETRSPRIPWYDPNAKADFVANQAHILLMALIDKGARFYTYGGEEIMYLNGEVIDIYRKQELLSAIGRYLNVPRIPYANDVAVSLRYQAKPLYKTVPERTLDTVNGVKESNKIMTKYLNKPVRNWIREVIVNGLV